MPKVNPKILIWARETAGFSIEEAAKKLVISEDRLAAFESGNAEPSRKQLANMAERYRRSLLTFYLSEPPRPKEFGEDFRSLPPDQREAAAPLLSALIRDVYARQSLIKSALEDADDAKTLEFVGSARMAMGVPAVAAAIREEIKFTRQDFRGQNSVSDAFAVLREGAERAGIFVLLMGNLGTHHTDIDVRAFRGFALSDPVAPFVVINEKDARTSWSFTLLHELTHIWLGQTGVSGYDGEAAVEKFCDKVAAEILLDQAELDEIPPNARNNFELLIGRLSEFAERRKISRKMVAFNLLSTNRISREMYSRLIRQFDDDRVEAARSKEKAGSGPDYYVVRRHRMGPGLVDTVRRMVADGALTTSKAGKVLGVKPTAVTRLVGSGAG
jgi:Zn-dependent peptidase ImmA (M78 family)/transcriptional regulator with XRE-family HTH domain